MNIPPFWARARYEGEDAKGRTARFSACGWSFSSVQEARDDALARAKRIFDHITKGSKPLRYEYHDRPIREEILERVLENEEHSAIITRNRYGARILNCSNILFIDIDFPPPKASGVLESILMAFSSAKRKQKWKAAMESSIQGVTTWAENNAQHSFRLYRTSAGLRLLFTDALYDPVSDETAMMLTALKADPLYAKLTQKQSCFRARLTSKPWRCNCPNPPDGFPWKDAGAEATYRRWEASYAKLDAGYKSCELVAEFGESSENEELKKIVEIHDRESKTALNAPLA